MIILETPRCKLRTFTKEDSNSLFSILKSKEVMRYSMAGPLDLLAVKNLIDEWIVLFGSRGFSPWAVIHDNQIIGYAGFDTRVVEGVEKIQITFRLSKNYWGRGLATEIATTLKEYAFHKLKLSEIIAIVDPENSASIKTIKRIGMKNEKKIIYGSLSLELYRVTQYSS